MEIGENDLLVVVDVQVDFCSDGAIPVANGEEVIETIHRIAPRFHHIVLTQDWHPLGHVSFASSHPGRAVYEETPTAYGSQRLWPDHCVQGTAGAEFHPLLSLPTAELILRKGFRRELDSYSAFFENDQTTPTGLNGYMAARGLTRAFFVGLAYDYCVGESAVGARKCGFGAVVIKDGCRAIDSRGSIERIELKFQGAGVTVVGSGDL